MKIIQTLWSKPANITTFRKMIYIAALSVLYAKDSGYDITLYTDSKAYDILKHLPYAEIHNVLDSFDVNSKMFAAPKYYALKREGAGTLHIDYDVFLKKSCLDKAFKADCDVILQDDEGLVHRMDTISWMREHEYPKNMDLASKTKNYKSYNVGIIGFNDQELQDKFIANYEEAVEMYAKYGEELPPVDFVVEQAYIPQLLDKEGKKPYFLLTGMTFADKTELANSIGYCHMQSKAKFRPEYVEQVRQVLERKYPEYLQLIDEYFWPGRK